MKIIMNIHIMKVIQYKDGKIIYVNFNNRHFIM